YRRAQGNFTVTQNQAVTAADYQAFCIAAPNDSRLPNPGAQVCGLYDLTPAAATRTTNNVVTINDASRQRSETWNGVDVAITARFSQRTFMSGGVSTGRTAYSNCAVVNNPGLFPNGGTATAPLTNDGYCAWSTPFLTQVKFAGVHTFQWDVQASMALQSNPGP